MKITRKDVEAQFELLAEAKGFKPNAYEPGSYVLDYHNPGGNPYVWRIEKVSDTGTGVSHGFPHSGRVKTSEMYYYIRGLLHAHYNDF